jgi:nuclear transport factor 2 (NTF2) superfamily protein
MRKHLISETPRSARSSEQAWLDIERAASVEVTSEQDGYPIESALLLTEKERGWRASSPGPQTIRLIFDEPQRLRLIRLAFDDAENQRTQEFLLRWSPDRGRSFRDIVRQQWNFSPFGSVRETEDYVVEIPDATILELIIVPDLSRGKGLASLSNLRLA